MPRRKPIIGVMGPGKTATHKERRLAFALGKLLAEQGWIVLSGGVRAGVMDAVSKGAKSAGGLTIGIIPRITTKISRWVDVPIITDMARARNAINALSCDVMIVCGLSAGTVSEIAFAIQAEKSVVFLAAPRPTFAFFYRFDKILIHAARTPKQAVQMTEKLLGRRWRAKRRKP